MSAPTTWSVCPVCEGAGEITHEPPGWWHGSGVMIQQWPCRVCDERGAVDLSDPDVVRLIENALEPRP